MTTIKRGTAITLDLPTVLPQEKTWFAEARKLRTAVAMRSALLERYPQLDPHRLSEIAIVGAASEGERLIKLAEEANLSVRAIADDNPTYKNRKVGGHIVTTIKELTHLDKHTPVVIASHRPLKLVQRLLAMGFETVALFSVLQTLDADRFEPHMFYNGWLEDIEANIDRYEELLDIVGDDESRHHLDAILGFRLTGDIGVLAPIIDWNVYAPAGLFEFTSNEVYVDAGAFDGDSIRFFCQSVDGKFEHIIGFEPDPDSFAQLTATFENDARIETIPKGLYHRNGVIRFASEQSRNSMVVDDGNIEISVTSLDHHLAGGRVSYIKMNIEGSELDALRGAQRSIASWGPKLAISAYHRPSDLWQVPFLIKELRPAYKLAIRQHDAGVIETVAYGF